MNTISPQRCGSCIEVIELTPAVRKALQEKGLLT